MVAEAPLLLLTSHNAAQDNGGVGGLSKTVGKVTAGLGPLTQFANHKVNFFKLDMKRKKVQLMREKLLSVKTCRNPQGLHS